MPTNKEPLKRPQIISFLVVLTVLAILIFFILKPFLTILALGIIVAILFQPVYIFFLKHTRSSSWASLITVFIIILIILGPVLFFGQILFTELTHLYAQIKDGHLVLSQDQITQNIPASLQNFIGRFSQDINNVFDNLAKNTFNSIGGLLSNVFGFFLGLFLFLFSVYFILKDSDSIIDLIKGVSPIDTNQERVLMNRIISAVNGVVKGQFLVALCQGTVATIGMIIFGVPAPFLVGTMVVVASLVPNIGTTLVMLPVVAYLYITGNAPQALGLFIWSSIAIGGIDNLISPRLVGSQLKLHPLLVLLAVIGGLQFFGFLGFLIGPILMAIFVQMIEMYRTDLRKYIHS